MTKMKTSIGLAAVLLAGAVSLPAFAMSDFDEDFLIAQLKDRGITATDVYENGDNVFRADVKLADGTTQFQYFYEDTLQQVKPAGSETRVLSKVDVVRDTPKAPSTHSLLYDGDGDNI